MSLVELGEGALLKGQFEKAQWAFDAEVYLHCPSPCKRDPALWQRGLSCYYSGHYWEGAEQFEADLSEKGSDVEEVIWNFLCRCGTDGFQGAVAHGFLPLRDDHPPVPPMQQVLDLYRGTGSVKEVFAAATDAGSMVRSYNDTNALAYAHFYIGLYHEVRGEFSRARHHLEVAAKFKNPDYMGKLMVMHYKLFCCRYSSRIPHSRTSETRLNPTKIPSNSSETTSRPSETPSNTFETGSNSSLSSAAHTRIIQGGWQLSKGHSPHCNPGDRYDVGVVWNLLQAFDAGIRSFDCGDIYTGVEELYGRLTRAHRSRGGRGDDIAIHTKLVPDLRSIQSHSVSREYIESVVRRSLNRLGVESVSLVQLHWWDTSVPGCVEALRALRDLVRNGLIGNIGITNFDTMITKSFLDAGIQIASTQVSLVDVGNGLS